MYGKGPLLKEVPDTKVSDKTVDPKEEALRRRLLADQKKTNELIQQRKRGF